MMTPTERSQFIGGLIASTPYVLIAWVCMQFTEDVPFWKVLSVVVGVRLLYGLIDTLGSVLAWRTYGRALAIKGALRLFRENKFPPRQFRHDDASTYLSRIKESDRYEIGLRRTAGEFERALEMFDDMGMLKGWRMRSATETALDVYAPRITAEDCI